MLFMARLLSASPLMLATLYRARRLRLERAVERRTVPPMPSFSDWFPPAAVGTMLTALGALKLYGLARGIEGERGKPLGQYICGT